MLLKNEERHSANECQGSKVTHQNSVGLNLALVGAVSAKRSGDANGDGVEDNDKTGAGNVDKVIKLQRG